MPSTERQPIDDRLQGWQRITTQLKHELGQTLFTYWMANLHLIAADARQVVIGVSSRFERDKVSSAYGHLIAKLVAAEWPECGPVEFVVAPGPRPAAAAHELDCAPEQLPAATVVAGSIPLNPAYSFANFVTGRANEIAVAQARAVAEGAAATANPLILFGASGLGKSHLLHATARRLLERDPSKRVLYVTADWFLGNFCAAARDGERDAFKQLVRNVDLLVLDDLHMLAGKDKTIDEFLATFDSLLDTGKQILLAADRSPALLEQLNERARSRLLKGSSVEIKASDFDLRLAILEAKAAVLRRQHANLQLGSEALRFMAQRINANTRELEGALYRVVSHSQGGAHSITLTNLQAWLDDFLRVHDRRVTIDEIKVKTANFVGCRVADLDSVSRAREIVRPRQIAMFLARRLTNRSLPDIARRFHKKDHTTVIHAIKTIEAQCARDVDFARSLETLRRSIRNWPDDPPLI